MSHVLASWQWGDFKSRWGWRPTRVAWHDGAGVVAAAQLLRRPIPRTPFAIGYASKGPIGELDDPVVAQRVLADLVAEAKRQRCLFVKIDPDMPTRTPDFVALLRREGWQRGEPIQFPNTATISLAPERDELLAAMKSKTRYNIRLAERRGIEVSEGSAADYALFYEMYRETAARDGFLIRPRAYYLDLWRALDRQSMSHLLIAAKEGTPVAGLILFTFGETAWYFYGASTDLHRRDMPTYALQWAAIEWAKRHGFASYDLWGAPTDLNDESDGLAGVWRFKEGFAPTFREQIGAWDYPIFPLGYRLYNEAIPRFLAWLRRR
ncbi:MAG: peptidoglycan bridge formation glycyltransferase FemA/FemB family protein [Anaerolineales bacterium]|nr:peptidoglycan bridge formation glycyltransferase FemA/FemB family protein [Anaerolineales bacterium]MCB9128983.1 peptidoglycan bridge formation glycyltransferase FemA/FemB family protein [Ardenticatenales bacterium]